MRRIAQDDGFSLMPGKNCQRMTEHLQSDLIGDPGFFFALSLWGERPWILSLIRSPIRSGASVGNDSSGHIGYFHTNDTSLRPTAPHECLTMSQAIAPN